MIYVNVEHVNIFNERPNTTFLIRIIMYAFLTLLYLWERCYNAFYFLSLRIVVLIGFCTDRDVYGPSS